MPKVVSMNSFPTFLVNIPFLFVFYSFPFFAVQETLENVKKCKNFLSTLIKLASSGKQSSETAANVKELVKSLLVRTSVRLSVRVSLPCWLCL